VRLIVRPDAEADIGDAHVWFEAQWPGLGQRFIGAIPLSGRNSWTVTPNYAMQRSAAFVAPAPLDTP